MKLQVLWLIAFVMMPALLVAETDPKVRPPSAIPAPEPSTPPSLGRIRIASQVDVGESAPGFGLTSATGSEIRLSSYRGQRVLLAFADRRDAFARLGAVAESLRAAGVLLVGVCRESPGRLRSLADRANLRFDLLSDQNGEVAALYGAYDFSASATRAGYVLIGRRGTVRMVLLGQALPPADLLQITRYALTGL